MVKGNPQMIPEVPFAPRRLSCLPVEVIGQLEDLVHEED